MKSIIKSWAIATISLYLTTLLIPGLKISGGIKSYLIAGGILVLLNMFLKPLIQLLFLPINLLTLGLLGWLVSVAILWAARMVTPNLTINGFYFAGGHYQGFIVPAMKLSVFWTTTLAAFLLNLISSLMNWIIKD